MRKLHLPILILVSLLAAAPGVLADRARGAEAYTSARCGECHEAMAADHAASAAHKEVRCLSCHPGAARIDHESPVPVDCRRCHAPHHEKTLHDPHSLVSCKACHMKGGIPGADPGSGRVVWSGAIEPGSEFRPHEPVRSREDGLCRKCHFRGNDLGAAAMVLPPKSVLCMPCHAATLSAGDATTLAALLVFLVGMAGLAVIWFSGTRPSPGGYRPKRLLHTLIFDVILLERLYRLSPARWLVHAAIFFPLLLRLIFGLTVLALSLWAPAWPPTVALLDKNNAARALFFDLTGLVMLAGTLAALGRRWGLWTGAEVKKLRSWEGEGMDSHGSGSSPAGIAMAGAAAGRRNGEIVLLPEPGWGMTALLALMVLAGFVLKGARIAMTGWPAGSEYAFAGYGISLLLKGAGGLTDVYGYIWYAHAVSVGAFVALIPFTRMSHVVTAPAVLLMNAREKAP